MSYEENESWTSYVEFGRQYRETHPQYTSHRKRSTTIWLELRKKNGCSDTKYSHKISCKYWPKKFHKAVFKTIQQWKDELGTLNITNPHLTRTKKKQIFRPSHTSSSGVKIKKEFRISKKKQRKLDLKAKGKDSLYAKSMAYNLEMDDDEIFPVLRKMKKRDMIRYCDYFKLGYSMETHRDKLLSTVTRHFIQRSRTQKETSIEFMEEDLFWHSIAHQENNPNQSNSKVIYYKD